jgi:hypothetical protein
MKKSGIKFESRPSVLEGPIKTFEIAIKKKQIIMKILLGALLMIKPMNVVVMTWKIGAIAIIFPKCFT